MANSTQGESLSPCGMRQAELTGIRTCQCTTGRNVRKIVYSCMSRASQTAFTIARHLNVRLERSEDLIEGHPANEVVSSIYQRLCDWSTDTCMYKLNYDLLYTGWKKDGKSIQAVFSQGRVSGADWHHWYTSVPCKCDQTLHLQVSSYIYIYATCIIICMKPMYFFMFRRALQLPIATWECVTGKLLCNCHQD